MSLEENLSQKVLRSCFISSQLRIKVFLYGSKPWPLLFHIKTIQIQRLKNVVLTKYRTPSNFPEEPAGRVLAEVMSQRNMLNKDQYR